MSELKANGSRPIITAQFYPLLGNLKWSFVKRLLGFAGKERIALASFPRSGNTWVRALLEEATGRETGSIYEDRVMPRSKDGIAIKTHALDSHRYTAAIHIVRNPYDVLTSFFRYKRNIAGHTNLDWESHVYERTQRWKQHTDHWLNAHVPTHLIRYEDLQEHPERELRKLLRWLDFDTDKLSLSHVIEATTLENMRR